MKILGGSIAAITAAAPTALWAALIFTMSTERFSRRNTEAWAARWSAAFDLHLPHFWLERSLTIVRSSAHFAEFFVFVWLLDRALAKRAALSPLSSATWAVAVAALYGLLDEIHQRFVPGRSPSPYDWAIDVLGGALAGLLIVTRPSPAVSREPTLSRSGICS